MAWCNCEANFLARIKETNKVTKSNYRNDAHDDATTAIEHHLDEIIEHITSYGEVPVDPMNDLSGFDDYHHANHNDRDYSLQESAELLDQMRDYEETDDGLWEGLEPQRAISVQAALTYGNAVVGLIHEKLRELAKDDDLQKTIEIYQAAECLTESDYSKAALESAKAEMERLINDLLQTY